MFKWDRLLRRNKLNKPTNYKLDESMRQDLDSSAEAYHSIKETVSMDNYTNGASEVDPNEYEVVEMEILPAKIICHDCGGITLEGLEFCDKCGGEL
ncbi:MAG: hypothetical protein QM217_07810 [Bacillota bacterium]|jgi:hypothetical protein|nr:hypothetical protein [Bacillota bacterium]